MEIYPKIQRQYMRECTVTPLSAYLIVCLSVCLSHTLCLCLYHSPCLCLSISPSLYVSLIDSIAVLPPNPICAFFDNRGPSGTLPDGFPMKSNMLDIFRPIFKHPKIGPQKKRKEKILKKFIFRKEIGPKSERFFHRF